LQDGWSHSNLRCYSDRVELLRIIVPGVLPIFVVGKELGSGPASANGVRNGLRLRHAFLLHEQFKDAIAPAACRHFEHAGLVALAIDDGPNVEALQERTRRNTCSIEMPAFT
jgi:hypothetical protein